MFTVKEDINIIYFMQFKNLFWRRGNLYELWYLVSWFGTYSVCLVVFQHLSLPVFSTHKTIMEYKWTVHVFRFAHITCENTQAKRDSINYFVLMKFGSCICHFLNKAYYIYVFQFSWCILRQITKTITCLGKLFYNI